MQTNHVQIRLVIFIIGNIVIFSDRCFGHFDSIDILEHL